MKTITDFLPLIHAECGSAPIPLVTQEAYIVLEDFLFNTKLWNKVLPIAIVADRDDFYINGHLTDNERFNVVEYFQYPLGNDLTYSIEIADDTGEEYILLANALSEAQFTAGDVFFCKINVLPVMGSDMAIPDWIFIRYASQIAAGIKARLQTITKKDWTDFDRARVNADIYNQGKNHATSVKYNLVTRMGVS